MARSAARCRPYRPTPCRSPFLFVTTASLLLAAAASASPGAEPSAAAAGPAAAASPRPRRHWYTYPTVGGLATGNRVLDPPRAADSAASSPNATTTPRPPSPAFPSVEIDVTLEDGAGDVVWIVAASIDDGAGIVEGVGGGEDEGGRFRFVLTTAEGRAYIVGPSPSPKNGGERGESTEEWSAVRIGDYAPLSARSPPVVRSVPSPDTVTGDGTGDGIEMVTLSAPNLAPLSHPVAVPSPPCEHGGDDDGGDDEPEEPPPATLALYAYLSSSGGLILWDDTSGAELDRLENIGGLVDGRIVVSSTAPNNIGSDEGGASGEVLLALYGGATNTYQHCVLGDCEEGSRLLVAAVDFGGRNGQQQGPPRLILRADAALPGGTVFEGLGPFFLSDGSGLVATVSDAANGGRLRTYSLDGAVLAESPSLGWGWRHQLFHADMGPPASPLPCIVDVLTPHVRKVVEFFDPATLTLVRPDAQVGGEYTTHSIGSRNLDTGFSGDMDGDGIAEAVLPTADGGSLAGVQLRPSGTNGDGMEAEVGGWDGDLAVEEVWRVSLPGGGKLSSNVVAARESDGDRAAMAAAVGGAIRIWIGGGGSASSPPSTAEVGGIESETRSAATFTLAPPRVRTVIAVATWATALILSV